MTQTGFKLVYKAEDDLRLLICPNFPSARGLGDGSAGKVPNKH